LWDPRGRETPRRYEVRALCVHDEQVGLLLHFERAGDLLLADPAAGKERDKLTDKTTLVSAVNEGFTYCDDAFAGLTDENALEMLTVGSGANQRQVARQIS
jgi:hypothetical protein